MIRPPPRSPLFPSPTLSRSCAAGRRKGRGPRAPSECRCGADPPPVRARIPDGSFAPRATRRQGFEQRSEEHTSELQSRSDLVCRLLLEKKKKIKIISRLLHD